MDDFLSIIVVVALYLAIAAGGNKKKKTRNAKQRASRTRDAAFDQAFAGAGKASARTASSQEKGTLARNNEACVSSRIHLHEVTQRQMAESAEGEDPCHRGGADAVQDVHEGAEFSYDEVKLEQSALAQDVLRGVIMSEILTRPSDRAAIRRNRRSIR